MSSMSNLIVCRLPREAMPEVIAIEQAASCAPWSERQFAGEFDHPCAQIFGISLDGILCGFLIFQIVGAEAQVMNFAVKPSFQGRGFGRRLFEEALNELLAAGVAEVHLEVRSSNQRARNLYLSCGFSEIGCRRSYYHAHDEDAVLMRAMLERKSTCSSSNTKSNKISKQLPRI